MRRRVPTFLVFGLMGLGLLLLAVIAAGRWTEATQIALLRERGEARLELYATLLEQELGRYHYLPAAVQLNLDVLALLRDPHDQIAAGQAARFLKALNAEAGASELYVIDRTGKVIAASNWDDEISFVGVDLSYRPYFQDALRTGTGRFYGIGTTSGEPGYFYAKAIVERGRVLGVATVKVSLDKLQSPWRQVPAQAAMAVDNDGVIILASEPGWKYRTVEPLPQAVLDRFKTTRQFENLPLEPLRIRTKRVLDVGARIVSLRFGDTGEYHRFILQERALRDSDWRMTVLSDLKEVQTATLAVQTMTGLGLGLAMLLVLFLRQRRRVIRLELAAGRAFEHANIELERKVMERTRDLLAVQDELVHAGKLAVLGQMSAGITHELNQPLAALRTLSDNARTLLQRHQSADAEANLVMIAQIIDRMAQITSQLKIFARKQKGVVGPVTIKPSIDHALMVVEPRRRAQNVKIRLMIEGAEIYAVADAARLEQVLVNLLANAVDAIGNVKGGEITIAVSSSKGRVTIAVADNGPGIPTDVLPHLLEPFFTTKETGVGLGLGLTICDGIVREFGGSLSARNLPDGGAEFAVELTAPPSITGENDA